jgi:CBS domain containing-hemolysin-like protein
MEASWVWPVVALASLIILSAFFSGSETALIGSGRVKLAHMAEKRKRGAKRALSLVEKPGELLATILVGNNLVNVMAAAVATVLMGPIYATILVTLLLLIFAEITPKTLAAHQPERFATRVAVPVQAFGLLFKPVVWVTTGLTDLFLWPFLGGKRLRERRLSRQELLVAIRLGARDGELEPSESRMTREILALKDTPVRRIMLPLRNVEGIPESADYEEMMREVARSGNTRYPIYREDLTDPIGLLHAKDLLINREGAEENWRQYVRPLMRVAANLEADELLRDMQIQRSHMAAVEDSEGTVIGIVTMEDVLEEIVGEIQDEYDDDELELIREVNPGRFLVHGKVEVDDLCKVINADLGQKDQHVTLSQWFDKMCTAECANARRLKVGRVRVIRRERGRFEILIRWPSGVHPGPGGG